MIITSNLFKYNGRKPNGKKPTQIWNANITINEAAGDPTKSPTEDYLIANNMLYTSAGQIAAIRIDANKTTSGIVVKDNVLRGENHKILVQGDQARKAVVKDND